MDDILKKETKLKIKILKHQHHHKKETNINNDLQNLYKIDPDD